MSHCQEKINYCTFSVLCHLSITKNKWTSSGFTKILGNYQEFNHFLVFLPSRKEKTVKVHHVMTLR